MDSFIIIEDNTKDLFFLKISLVIYSKEMLCVHVVLHLFHIVLCGFLRLFNFCIVSVFSGNPHSLVESEDGLDITVTFHFLFSAFVILLDT